MHRNVSDVWSYMFGFRQRECRKAGSAGLQTDEGLEFYRHLVGINKEIRLFLFRSYPLPHRI